MSKHAVCLDIGGSKILGAIFSNKDEIIFRLKKKTNASSGRANIEDTIVGLVEELLRSGKIEMRDVSAIAAGAPGVIDEKSGTILFSPNLPWRDYEIKKILEKRFGCPFYIGNDVSVGTYGEWRYGAARGYDHVVSLFVGTGMGGGLILDGRLYNGFCFKGTELGHMVLDTNGPKCNCGQRGCLEAFSSKVGMTNYIQQQIKRGRKTNMADAVSEGVFKSKSMKQAYEKKDPVMIEAIDRACHYLAVASGNLINIFSPQIIVYGGGVMEALGDVFIKKIIKEVDRYCMPSIRSTVSLSKAELEDDSILFGALAMIRDQGL